MGNSLDFIKYFKVGVTVQYINWPLEKKPPSKVDVLVSGRDTGHQSGGDDEILWRRRAPIVDVYAAQRRVERFR